ncbi:MAG: hypothetical protein HZR80_17750 [Candidatus Heimdallarchaeota archaeon]
MVNVKIIIDAIAIPLGSIATIMIISKNRHNIANILMGIIAFLGGVQAVMFDMLKEHFYDINNQKPSILLAKFVYLSLFLMTIPALSFSIFFWRAKYKGIPRYLHFFVFLPALSLTLWLFIDQNIITLVETPYGTNNFLRKPFTVYSSLIMFLIIALLTVELSIIARRTHSFPDLRKRMNIFAIGFGVGFGGAFVSIFLFQFIFKDTIQPSALFVIIFAISFTWVFSTTLSRGKTKLWHGCPKLLIESSGETFCLNTDEGEPIPVKVLDLGDIIERIQIDTEILKTGSENCANTVFSDDNDCICCLTTHKPIKVLEEEVSREEMELARAMKIMQDRELCPECLHKIIAYRKEHKDKSDSEIKIIFLGISAEEFFGVV